MVLPADHIIENKQAFTAAVQNAVPLAEVGSLVTFGVMPDNPNQGYGYINAGERIGEGFRVASFKEKPDEQAAKEYLKIGGYYWNSGMFLVKSSVYLNELLKYSPKIYEACQLAVNKVEPDLAAIPLDYPEATFGWHLGRDNNDLPHVDCLPEVC